MVPQLNYAKLAGKLMFIKDLMEQRVGLTASHNKGQV